VAVTESEWLASQHPEPMLEFLRGRASDRKLRLFALACCYAIKRLIVNPAALDAIAFVERHVERGVVRRKGRPSVERAARNAHREDYNKMFSFPEGVERAKCLVVSNAINAASGTLDTDPNFAALYASAFSSWAIAWEAQVALGVGPYTESPPSLRRPEQKDQA